MKRIEYLKRIYEGRLIEINPKRLLITVPKDEFISALSTFKVNSFNQLTFVTAVDWIKESEFEIVANLYSRENRLNVFVKTRISRDNAEIQTITSIYSVAKKYEVELTEMFGIKVVGNEDAGKPFLLENWKSKPPLRKEFDSVAYAAEHYEARHVEEKND